MILKLLPNIFLTCSAVFSALAPVIVDALKIHDDVYYISSDRKYVQHKYGYHTFLLLPLVATFTKTAEF